MALLEFPESLLRSPSTAPPRLVGMSRSPGRTMSGVMPMSRSDGGGLWSFDRSGIVLRTRDQEMAWNALQAYLSDGARPIIVPFCHKRIMPAPTIGGEVVYSWPDVGHDDGSDHDDGSGYASRVVEAHLINSAILRRTLLDVSIDVGAAPNGGDFFSIHHETLGDRPYRVTHVEDLGGSAYTLTIEPPLREATAADIEINFDLPLCVMQLSGPGAMQMPQQMGRFASAQVSFIESFLPVPD